MKKCKLCKSEIEKTSDAELCAKCLTYAKMFNGEELFEHLEACAHALEMAIRFGDSAGQKRRKEWMEVRDAAWDLLREIEK